MTKRTLTLLTAALLTGLSAALSSCSESGANSAQTAADTTVAQTTYCLRTADGATKDVTGSFYYGKGYAIIQSSGGSFVTIGGTVAPGRCENIWGTAGNQPAVPAASDPASINPALIEPDSNEPDSNEPDSNEPVGGTPTLKYAATSASVSCILKDGFFFEVRITGGYSKNGVSYLKTTAGPLRVAGALIFGGTCENLKKTER